MAPGRHSKLARMQADPYQPAAYAPTSASDGSVSDHDDEKPAAAVVVAGSSSEVKDGKDDVKDNKVKDEKDVDAKDDKDGDDDDDEEVSPKRKRKAPVSEINEDLLAAHMGLAHPRSAPTFPSLEMRTEPRVGKSLWVRSAIFFPEQHPRHPGAAQFLVHLRPVGNGAIWVRHRGRCRKQQQLEAVIVQPIR